ncbi:MAG: response regulator [Mailhella sp.]|nr:response regulator [Mailhella sp.]
MDSGNKNTARIIVAGCAVIAFILVLGTVWMGKSAQKDSVDAVRSVSMLFLDELAGRREQVVSENLQDNVETIHVALRLLKEHYPEDLLQLREYQAQMKALFKLDRFAFVDTEGTVYTALGEQKDIDQYPFDFKTVSGPVIAVKNVKSRDKKVVIAVPVENMAVSGRQMLACFMEISMDLMLKDISLATQNSGITFCNIYTRDGIALSNTVLGGLAEEDNLLEALSHAEYGEGISYDSVARDFREGRKGVVSFSYGGIQETLCYVPVTGTDWLLTYLIRESVISERMKQVFTGTITRSVAQSLLAVLVLGLIFVYAMRQSRKNARLMLEKETIEAESRIKHQEMERRLELQEQMLMQKKQQEQQEKMIAALASDYRSIYYLELDKDRGVCYQSRSDLPGLRAGESFDYLETVTAYCDQYVLAPYREGFLRFVQPDSIREGLRSSSVISYLYMVNIGGREAYETVRFASVRHPGDRGGDTVHHVGACFADTDAETRKNLDQQQILREALDAAEHASTAKTVFLSNMSHEIRTPMNAIIGLNNIALNEPDVPDNIRGYLTKIGTSAQHLLGIINDILDMSRIESGRMLIKSEEFSFAKSLEQINTIISGQCRDKGLSYECRTAGTIDDHYIGDDVKLKQVLINILGNAVKFTPEGGSVSLLVEEGPRFGGKATLKFTVKDTGIGMSKEYLPHIFDAFSQEETSSTSKYGSTGLGMPIAKSIVELMNGHIDVESEKGVGTTFTVTVTLGEASGKGETADEGDLRPREMTVLVIDDDPIALDHAQIILGQAGMKCELAASGGEGLEKIALRHARKTDYDLIIVDWKMPGMDGVETTRQIRAIVGSGTPIIILTSYNWDEIAGEAKEAGVDTFVAKPLFAGSVMDEFRRAFRKKKETMDVRRAELKGRRILLAEDVPVNAEIMVMILGMRGIDADLAENGRIAVEKFTGQPAGTYDAILMDMRMPEMDGLEATRLIRSSGHEDSGTIPIIALTANAFDEDVQRSLQAGLNAHLSKPVEPEALFSTLEALIMP